MTFPASSPPLALAWSDAGGLAVLAALAVLLVLVAVRLARGHRKPPAAPASQAEIEKELAGAELTEAQEEGRQEVRGERPARSEGAAAPAPGGTAPTPSRESREAEEARKKEEYRQKKEAERAEKERRAQEREEEARRAREAEEQRAREAEEARRRVLAEERRQAEAQAGQTLAAGLARTRGGFMARLSALFAGPAVDERTLAELEEVLFTADIGVKTATALLEAVRDKVRRKELTDPARLKAALRAEIERIVSVPTTAGPDGLAIGSARPWVVMVAGVNGSGKTTTIGKLAARIQAGGRSVLLGAGDTFRAAASEQLEIWAERVGAPCVRGKDGADPASVCFEAVKEGVARGVEVVLCDTAGRLHTKTPLMEELRKVKRVMGKAAEGAPHEVLLVLDATNGQNAIAQARQFHEALGVTGLVLTKLDGTAKGGVVIGICDELKLPVRFAGVGEKVADLRPFDPREFVAALFE